MYFKIAVISFLVATCHAGLIVDEGHGHAVSSQSIIRHDQPTHQVADHYATPVIQQAAPLIQHAGPLIQHAAPVYDHSGYLQQSSILEHGTPYVHSAPLVQHVAQHGSILQHLAPVSSKVVAPVSIGHEQIETHAPAHYEYSYSVEDPHTGDHKSQHESRDGDVVKGEYSLLEADGSIRKVEYTADHEHGFNAIVHNSGPSAHAAPAPAAHLVHGTPVLASHH